MAQLLLSSSLLANSVDTQLQQALQMVEECLQNLANNSTYYHSLLQQVFTPSPTAAASLQTSLSAGGLQIPLEILYPKSDFSGINSVNGAYTTTAWSWRGEAAHHIQTSPRAPSVCAATVVEAGAQGTDEAVTQVHGPSAESADWAEAALPPSISEATPCNDWRFRSARAAAAASGLRPQGLFTIWRSSGCLGYHRRQQYLFECGNLCSRNK
jgi:hypothetical protein